MITRAHADKLVVISDLHLGNPFSKSRDRPLRFLRWAAERGFDICINGDGLEIAQVSFGKLAEEIPEVIRAFKDLMKVGRSIYYTVGNHDIALEHFLEDWGALKVAPFLNLSSGTARIRIEHGHLYDPFFVKNPRFYEICTQLGGLFLKLKPEVYKLWIGFERAKAKARSKKSGIAGEPPEFAEAAHELARRGFDAVIFGHTHHRGEADLGNGARYFNPGSWLLSSDYVEIDHGRVALRSWAES